MIVQGPLALNWRRRKWGVLPRLENSALDSSNPPSLGRLRLWARQGIHVAGRPEWIFVKVHTHGCVPANQAVLLGPAMQRLHATLGADFNDGVRWRLHYVTAREMYNIIRAAESGKCGDPGEWRDFKIGRPACAGQVK